MLQASLATFALHVESRVAAAKGKGFYTIGPCGEELMSALGAQLQPTDACALHYRHLASQLARSLASGDSLEALILARARAHTASIHDKVTGGRHCALGGSAHDYYVTSTLASQTPPAVGRALADPLANALRLPHAAAGGNDTVSVVTIGDGSTNNAHFLAAKNLAEHASHRNIKCPLLMVCTDNDISISYKGRGWMQAFKKTFVMPVLEANGADPASVYHTIHQALQQVRSSRKPAFLLINNVPRRFGHAATDRQAAYLTPEEIARAEDASVLESLVDVAVAHDAVTLEQVRRLWDDITRLTRDAFETASKEPRLTDRADIARPLLAPLRLPHTKPQTLVTEVELPPVSASASASASTTTPLLNANVPREQRDTMRKHMTREIHATLENNADVVYIGEDVRHGGYYLVSDGLAKSFPTRVMDFPPDETTLLGAAQGFSQRGLLPIVEIPYAAYLNCGFDMFAEICATRWLTNGRQSHGMVVRIQGFDGGAMMFGGNYHTHNAVHLVPGSDVLCFSNGADWVRGFRQAVSAARRGRIVVLYDPTEALTRRHVERDDDAWLFPFPALATSSSSTSSLPLESDALDFDERVTLYASANARDSMDVLVVTYGTGVPRALAVARRYERENPGVRVGVVDAPYLSSPCVGAFDPCFSRVRKGVVFADPCKLGQNPFGTHVQVLGPSLARRGLAWRAVAAQPSYNPLVCSATFLSEEDIACGVAALLL